MELVSKRSGRGDALERVRPGAYVKANAWDAALPRERHVLKVRAASRSLIERAVYSHESAAAVHGIPLLADWPDEVHASYDGSNGMSAREGVKWYRAHWEDGDITEVARMRVTSPRRTAIDLARCRSLPQGVVALDHVIAHGVSRDELEWWMTMQPIIRGIASLRRAVGIARGLSESPLESLSMARFAEFGIPMPVQQREVTVGARRYRVDFFWPQFGVAGEADGRAKYLAAEDLWQEKRREDEIRRRVDTVVRWSWADAWAGAPLRILLAEAGILGD